MKLKHVKIEKSYGIELVEFSTDSSVVVLAGPNGVGKTRILNGVIGFFQNAKKNPGVSLIVEATSNLERNHWKKEALDTSNAEDAGLLQDRLRRNQRRNKYASTVLNFDSDRTIATVQPYQFSWDLADPLAEDVGWNASFSPLKSRYQDMQHSLFRLIESQRRKMSDDVVAAMSEGKSELPLQYPDPIAPYREAFFRLLGPKTLAELDTKTQVLSYIENGEKRNFSSLSSGEREVVNIVFDFIQRGPSDCIIIFDEPELHLHPELSYRLLQTLAEVGNNNQFILATHSPEIISASIDNTVVFLRPNVEVGQNQAIVVEREDETNSALNLIGQSIGVVSLGKKLLLLEGTDSSIDKQTYGSILRNEFPDHILVPVGGKKALTSFEDVKKSIIDKTIWGIEFFMLCDGDAVNELGARSSSHHFSERLQPLPRYHLENYFLDEKVLASIFVEMEHDSSSWLCKPDAVALELQRLAKLAVPYAVALSVSGALRERVGNLDIMPKSLDGELASLIRSFEEKIESEKVRINADLDARMVGALAREQFDLLTKSIEDNTETWKQEIPGKVIFNRFAAKANMPTGRLRTLYVRYAREAESDPFAEIRDIFRSFRGVLL